MYYAAAVLYFIVLTIIIIIIWISVILRHIITIKYDRLTAKRKCISLSTPARDEGNICFQNVLQSAPGGFDRPRAARRLPRDGV